MRNLLHMLQRCTAGRLPGGGALAHDSDARPEGHTHSNCSHPTGTRHLLHMLQRCDDAGCRELVRCRTAWRPSPNAIDANAALGTAE